MTCIYTNRNVIMVISIIAKKILIFANGHKVGKFLSCAKGKRKMGVRGDGGIFML